jgi:hypothetical protein
MVTYALTFNQPLNPLEVVRHTSVRPKSGRRSRRTIGVRLLGGARPNERIVLQSPHHGSRDLVLAIDGALRAHDGDLTLDESVKVPLVVPTRFVLLDVEPYAGGLDPTSRVRLNFSSAIDATTKLNAIKLEPRVESLSVRHSFGDVMLEGEFESGRLYTVRVDPSIQDRAGVPLAEAQERSFRIPDRRPGLRFEAHRGVLMPSGNLDLDLDLVNVSEVQITAQRVHANNLVAHIRGTAMRGTARRSGQRRIKLQAEHNVPQRVTLDIREVVNDPRGIYAVRVQDVAGGWRTDDTSVVTVTDMAVTGKRHRGGFLAWVTSLSSAEPVAGVTVTARSYNNQVLAQATTRVDGVAELDMPADHPDGDVFVVVAERGDDLSYLEPQRRPWVVDHVDQAGKRYAEGLDVLLYTERGAYRPGDAVHVAGIARYGDGSTPSDVPLRVRLERPDGRLIAEPLVRTDDQGTWAVDLQTPEDGQTGSYHISATLPGSDIVVGSTDVIVAAFMPARFEVHADAHAVDWRPGDSVEVSVQANYLFGGSTAGLRTRVVGVLQPRAFETALHPKLAFDTPVVQDRAVFKPIEGTLDAEGRLALQVPLPEALPCGVWRAVFNVTVTEVGGRSVSTRATLDLDTAPVHIGLAVQDDVVVTPGRAVDIEWAHIQTAWTQAIAPTTTMLQLERLEFDPTLEEVSGRLVWKSVERRIPVLGCHLDDLEAGHGVTSITCPSPGRYRVALAVPATGQRAAVEFYAASGQSDYDAAMTERPSLADLVLDQPTYTPGEHATVLVRSPFAGRGLVTLETHDIVVYRTFEMTETTARVSIEIPNDVRGGAFVSASIVRSLDPAAPQWLPHRALGLTRLQTDHTAHRLAMSLDIPERSRPRETIEAVVRTESPVDPQRPAMVNLWAVDDGILMTTGYGGPDLFEHFLGPRGSAVQTADLFSELMPDHRRPHTMIRIGADTAGPMRRSPIPAPTREPAVVWCGWQAVDRSGEARFTLELPDLHGRLRVFAIAADGDRYGGASREMTLSAPLTTEVGWPRFAAPGDRFDYPIKVFNTSDEPLSAHIQVSACGPIELSLPVPSEFTLPPGGQCIAWVSSFVHHLGLVDIAVDVTATLPTEVYSTSASRTVAIRPAEPLTTTSFTHLCEVGEDCTIPLKSRFEAQQVRTQVTVSAVPTSDLLPALQGLIDYPHGCAEQTISRMFAILAMYELESGDGQQLLDAGFDRLWAMQTVSGGLSYWPGDTAEHPWASAYGGLLVVAAEQAGVQVNPQFKGPLLDYLERSLTSHTEDHLKALLCEALSAVGRPPVGWMASLRSRAAALDVGGRARLALAFINSGDSAVARTLLSRDNRAGAVFTPRRGRFTSPLQQQALRLRALHGSDPANPEIPDLARRIENARQDGRWSNTVETAAAVRALARLRDAQAEPASFSGRVVIDGQPQGAVDHLDPTHVMLPFEPERIAVETAGQGRVYVVVQREGLPASGKGVDAYDRQLVVRRRWRDGQGGAVDPTRVRVGELVHVEVTVAGPALQRHNVHEHVAIVDALPGGFEVEDPRLNTSARHELTSTPERTEFLDDRVIIFTSVGRKTRTFRYALRAVTPGSFIVPPIQASSMYDAGIASRGRSGRVEVVQ